ncbi:sigma-54-dependent Fis family transcriptional regulator [bacterium]|nr:sigma-54-dependent Fis family transcriptional regulator [bacterium]
MARILVVDDEQRNTQLLRFHLEGEGHEVVEMADGASALAAIDGQAFDLVLTDLRMEPVDGMQVIDGVKGHDPDTPVIMLTAYADYETAVEAMARGAATYIKKPWKTEEVKLAVARALDGASLRRENRVLRQEVRKLSGAPSVLGGSAAMQALRDLIARVAPSGATVMIRGESGAGKEVAARAIHDASERAGGPFVAVNCAAIPETLLESELFGYRKGAFTGADSDKEGLFEAASGGTLFLDEIGEAGGGVQAKLLRVLEERKINRVGDPRERAVDVRVLAATNRPLEDAIGEGRFREDLYYRLMVIPVDVPPLRERLDDVETLALHFLGGFGRDAAALSSVVIERLRGYGWPGNVRELRNVIERAHILAGPGELLPEHVMLDLRPGGGAQAAADPGGDLNLADHERRLIRAALQRAEGNKSQAATLLGITRRTLYSRLKVLEITDA